MMKKFIWIIILILFFSFSSVKVYATDGYAEEKSSEINNIRISGGAGDFICENDISAIDKKQRNPKIAKQILRSYAHKYGYIRIPSPKLTDSASLRQSVHFIEL